MIKKLSLSLVILLSTLATTYCSLVAVYTDNDPNDNPYPLFTSLEQRVIMSVFAAAFAIGALWAASRLWAHLKPGDHSKDVFATRRLRMPPGE